MAAVGTPQAILSEEDLAIKEAAKKGETLDATAMFRTHHNLSRRASAKNLQGTSPKREVTKSKSGGRRMIVPKEARGMVLPFEPLSISFDDISYYIDMPAVSSFFSNFTQLNLMCFQSQYCDFQSLARNIPHRFFFFLLQEMKHEGVTESKLKLLNNITGSFRPGVLTALVGVSGAGKTTLMDVLAGRKTGGYIEGEIRIAGYPKVQETFARIAGYCEQNDIHSPQLNVLESLLYSAWLRLSPDITDEDKKVCPHNCKHI